MNIDEILVQIQDKYNDDIAELDKDKIKSKDLKSTGELRKILTRLFGDLYKAKEKVNKQQKLIARLIEESRSREDKFYTYTKFLDELPKEALLSILENNKYFGTALYQLYTRKDS